MKAIIDKKYGALIISNAKVIHPLNDGYQALAEFADGTTYIIVGSDALVEKTFKAITTLLSSTTYDVSEIDWIPTVAVDKGVELVMDKG